MSYEPPLIKLGRRQRPDWPEALRKHADAIGAPLPKETGVVLSTRDAARKLQAEYGSIDTVVYLDVTDVELATPSYFDQLLIFWPRAQLIGAVDPEVRVSFELAQEHHGKKRADREATPSQEESQERQDERLKRISEEGTNLRPTTFAELRRKPPGQEEPDPDPYFGRPTGRECAACGVDEKVGDEGWESNEHDVWCADCWVEAPSQPTPGDRSEETR